MRSTIVLALLASTILFVGSADSLAADNSEQTLRTQDAAQSQLVEPGIQPLGEIKKAVERFIQASHESSSDINIDVKELDRRLRLAHCENHLLANWSPGSRSLGRVTVQVHCEGVKPWRVHIQATVTMDSNVWVLARGVRRGDVLEPGLLVEKTVTLGMNNAISASYGTPIFDLEPWLGFVFSRRVNAGQVIHERMLKPAKLVSKGEAVLIRHRGSGLELQTRGTALRDAGAREQIKVRNTSSGKVIDVVVVGPGVVDILD